VKRAEYQQVSDEAEVARAVDEAIAESPRAVADYKGGNAKALEAVFGAVMKRTKGKANPQIVRALLRKRLGDSPTAAG
jgi:aspartyl-tRNA(Asn)/glutamyl-tRNA(Gln) amidotransferase subunit B